MYVYIYIYIYTCICICLYVCVYIYIYIYIDPYALARAPDTQPEADGADRAPRPARGCVLVAAPNKMHVVGYE